MFTGIALISLGIMLALRQAGFITWFSMAEVWPMLLVAIGIRMVLKPRGVNCAVRVR